MLNLFTNLILVGCSETGLNALPVVTTPEANECGCPDYTDKIVDLETKINNLTDQLAQVHDDLLDNDARIADIEEAEPVASSLVVSEYLVDCTADREDMSESPELLRGYPLQYQDATIPYGCLVANIDITDRPYSIGISWLTDMTLTYPEDDWWNSMGNDLRYVPYAFDAMDAGGHTYITSTGDVYIGSAAGPGAEQFDSKGETAKAIPVRVVIIHNRPYSLPAYTP